MMKKALIVSCLAAVMLSACGGGDDDNHDTPGPADQVPGSASQSVDGFVAYLKALLVADADMREPVDLTAFTPPVDDAAPASSVE
jgi:hypothetical protein